MVVFNSDEASWHLVEDHRGKTVYDVASGDALFISELGPLPENVTWLSPEGEFQKWNGTSWIKDTEEETSLMEVWKMYRVMLIRVDTLTDYEFEWLVNLVRD